MISFFILCSILRNLRCSKISIGGVYAEEPGVQSKLGGTVSLSPRVLVPRAVLRSLPTSIGPYEPSEAIILRCSHTKRTQLENENGWNAIYMKERHRPRSIPITEDLLYSRH